MPAFVLMTRLGPENLDGVNARKIKGKKWFKKVKDRCPEVEWKAHYAILGPYDFMDIYEAPDVETAHKVSIISRTQGALYAESWQIMPYDNYLKLLKEIAD